MVSVTAKSAGDNMALWFMTDNRRLFYDWRKIYPNSAYTEEPTKNYYKIDVRISKQKFKNADNVMEAISPIVYAADMYGEKIPDEQINVLFKKDNFMKSYFATNRKFNADIGDMMQGLVTNNDTGDQTLQKLFMGYVPGGETVYGLSFGGTNPLFILSQDSGATYVASEQQWDRYFNRYVDETLNPIPVYIKTNSDTGIDMIKQIKMFGKELNAHQKKDLHKNLAGAAKTSGDKIYNSIVYDVRFTKVKEGEEDVFKEVAGLASNIYARENEVAKEIRKLKNNIRDNKAENTYDDEQYRQVNVNNVRDMRQSSNIMTSNINYFLRRNGYEEISHDRTFSGALNNLMEYEVNRDKAILNKQSTKTVTLAFLMRFFNVWQDGREFPSMEGIEFSTKAQYVACFYVIRQSCDVILGRYFGIGNVTRESVETEAQPQRIDGIPMPTMDQFLNFMGIDQKELSMMDKDQPIQKKEPVQNPQSQETQDEINKIKEQFQNFYNRMQK